MTTKDDTPGGAQAPADAGAPASGANQSELDFSDLDREQEAAAAAAAAGKDESDESGESTDEGDDNDGDSSSEEDADENADDDADGDDDDEDGDEDDDEQPQRGRSRSKRYRDRIAKLELENQQLRGRPQAGTGQLTDAQVDAKVKEIIGEPPKEADFANYLDFDRAAQAYELDKRQTARAVKQDDARDADSAKQRNVQRIEKHNDRIEEFRSRGSTKEERKANAEAFDAAMKGAKGLKIAPHVEDLLLDSDKSAHLQLYFAKNPNRLDQINRMSERDAARAIGGIETRLSVPKPKVKSSAPPPRQTPRGGAAQPSADGELDAYLNKEYGPNRR